MSQAPNSKGKDVGKPKYASLNINQTFKGTKKVEAKAAGQPRQHGFQTLGKVTQTRRVPQPANLPSLKKENLGNDPRIALVPTGSQGWGAKDRQTPPQKTSDPAPPSGAAPVNQTTKTTQKPGDSSTEISLRPNAGVVPSLKTSGNLRESGKPASWINKIQGQQPTGSATYFHREFPKLGGGEDKDGGGSGKDTTGEKSQGAGADMQLKISGSPVPIPDFQATHDQQRAMFNGPGQHGSYPYPGYMYPPPGPGARNFQMPPFPYSFPYQSGKMPGFDPNFARMPRPAYNPPPPRNEMPERPSIIKDTDLNSLDADSEDNGWAGAQEEVDYNAKLKFDESDESDDDRRPVSKAVPLSKEGPGSRTGRNDDDSSAGRQNQKDENNKQEWSDRQPDFSSKMSQGPPMDPQNWPRPPFPQPFGARGPPLPPFPYQPMYVVLNYPPPQQQQKQQQQQQQQQQSSLVEQQTESQSNTSSKLKTSRLNSEDDKVAMERKAAAQRRLDALEEKIKHREKVGNSELKADAKLAHSPDREPAGPEVRLRHDSEASDSSRKSFKMSKEVPPRFRRQMSGQPMDSAAPAAVVEEMPHSLSQTQETGPLRIMKRHDSAKSEDGVYVPPPVVTLSQPSANDEVVFKKPEVPVEKVKPIFTTQKDRGSSSRPVDGSTDASLKESRQSSAFSAQSSDQRVDARERTGSASSLSSVRAGRDGRDRGKRDSEARDGRKKLEREGRDRSDLDKKSDQRQPGDDVRPKDDVDRSGPKKMEKLTRGSARSEKTYEKEDSHRKPVEKQQASSGKAFPWAKVVSGERESGEEKAKDAVGSANAKSLRDIQKEEEAVEKAKENPIESEGLGTEPSEKGSFDEQGYRGRAGGSHDYGDRRNRRDDRDSRFEEHDIDKSNRKSGGDSRAFDGRDRPRYNDRRKKFDSDRRDYRQEDKPEFERRGGYGRSRDFNSASGPDDFVEGRGDEVRYDRRGELKDDRRGDMRNDRREEMRDDRRGDMRNDRRDEMRGGRRGDIRDDGRGVTRDDRRGVTRDDRRGESKDATGDEAGDDKRGEAKDGGVDEIRDDKQGDVMDDKQGDLKDDGRGERRDDKRDEGRDGRRREGRDERRGEGKGDGRARVDRRDDRYERRDVIARREESGKEKREDRNVKDERGDRRTDRRAERSDHQDEFRSERRVDREKRTRPDKQDRKGYDDGRDSRSDRRDRRDDAFDNRRERAAERFDRRKEREPRSGAREGNVFKSDQRDEKRAEREAGRGSRGRLDRDYEGTERKHDSGMRRRDEWSNRDYRQSEDYKRDIIEHEDRKKSETEKSSEAKPGQDIGGQAVVPVKSADRTDKSYKDVVQAKDDAVGEGGTVQQMPQKASSNILAQSINLKSMLPGADVDSIVVDAPSALAGPRIPAQLQREASAVTEATVIPQEAVAVDAAAEISAASAVPCEAENTDRDVRNSSEVSIADGRKSSNKEFRKNRSFDRYEFPGERHESRGRGRFAERGRTSSGRPRERGRGRGSGSFSGAFKEKDNDRGDPGSRQRPATGGYGRTSSSREKQNLRLESADGYSGSSYVTDSESASEDGAKSRPTQKRVDVGEVKRIPSVEGRKWENERPPRFQQQYQQQRSSDGRGGRGSSRSRGRGAFDRGRGFERGRGRGRRQSNDLYVSSGTASVAVPKPEVVDGDDQRVDEDSDCFFSADEVTPEEGENDSAKDRPARVASLDSKREALSSRSRGSRIRESSHRGRGKRLLSRGRGRGGLQAPGSKSSDSFLANRQQVGDEVNRVKGEIALPAADKSKTESKATHSTSSANVQPRSAVSRKSLDIEEISEHSPPKKYKPIEKKRDILKEYDLNDIASVVCVDDLMQSIDIANGMSATEDDGFVKVTSKKHTKELRDRQREEEKRKLLLEQQQQQREAAQAASRARKAEVAREKESVKENGPAKSKVSSFSDAPISATVVDPATVAVTSVPASLSHPQTSNAAMAAIGVWEPAQSLMRTSQLAHTDGKMSPGSSLPSTGANAWQRPLSLATAAVQSSVTAVLAPLPDPKAVGTGKPSSQHPKASSTSVVHSEVPSPLISPPALPLIGIVSGTVGKSANVPVHVADHGPSGLELKAVAESEIAVEDSRDVSSAPVAKEERYNDSQVIEAADALPDAKRPPKRTGKLINKKIMRETPPRFQTSQYKQQLQQQQSSSRKSDGRSDRMGDDSLSRKRSADRDQAVVSKAPLDKTIKPPPKRIGSGGSIELDVPSHNGDISKSLLSDADKVVGANKPVAPPSESLDHRSLISEKMQKRHASVEDADKLKEAAHTLKSSSDEDDRTLETRSLPGTPPLLVKIPEPSLSGPSSDPGRAPSPNVMVSMSSHIALEMNEMSRRLLFARKAWDDTPSSTWSESAMASSKPGGLEVALPTSKGEALLSVDIQSGKVGPDVEKSVVNPSSPTKVDSVVAVHASKAIVSTHVDKPTATIAQNSFVSKREHQSQNNVCKVKPQQLHAVDADSLSTGVAYSESRAPVSLMEPVGIAFNQQYSSVPYLSSGQLSKVQGPHQRYVLPLDQRQRQQAMPSNLQQPTIYSTDSFYGDLHTSQTLGFQSYGQQPPSSTQQPELVQQSLLLGNIYGAAGPLQPAQSQLLRWQVVSTPSVVPSSNTAYESRSQQSHFTGAGALSNPALVMPYNTRASETAFSPQRISHQLVGGQATAVSMLFNQQPQHAQHSVLGQPTGIFSMLQPDQLSGAQSLHAHSSVQPHAMASSSGHIPLMLDPSQAMLSAQHLDASGQRSDLTKHVNAKPFEPNISRTPPSLHSPPAVNHAMSVQSQLPNPQVSTIRGIGSHPSGRHDPSSQPLTKQSSSPLIASVRPRAAHAQSIASPSPPLSVLPAQSLGTVSPIDPSFAVLASVLGYKGAPIPAQNGLQQSFSIQQMQGQQQHVLQPVPARFTHQMMTGGRPFAVRQGSHLVVQPRAQVPVGPGPIQRPSTIVAAVPQVVTPARPPATANVPPTGSVSGGTGLSQPSQAPVISQSSEFRSLEHRRMIEETKRYFKEELHPTGNPPLGGTKSEKMSSVNADKGPSDGVSPEKESSERKFVDPTTSGLSAPLPQRKR